MSEFNYGFGFRSKRRIASDITELIGETPSLKLTRFANELQIPDMITAKLDFMNPGMSLFDVSALAMIKDAEESGELKRGMKIISVSDRFFALSLAVICASKEYKLFTVISDDATDSQKRVIEATGADVLVYDGADGFDGARRKALEIHNESDDSYFLDESAFDSDAHMITTGSGVLRDSYGDIDILVLPGEESGPFSGCADTFKAFKKDGEAVFAVISDDDCSDDTKANEETDPKSALLRAIGDNVFFAPYKEAKKLSSTVSRTEGIFPGEASGAVLFAAVKLAKMGKNRGKKIFALLPDSGLFDIR